MITIKKAIVFVIITLIILTVLVSCTGLTPAISLGNNFCNTNLLCGACDDENYVYFIAKDKKIMRISKETNKITDMEVSTHFLGALSIVDGYLYLDAGELNSGGCEMFIKPCKINLNKIKEITYFDYEIDNISSVGDPVIVIDDTIYFRGGLQKINRDGTGGAAIDDHPYQVIGVYNNSIYAFKYADEEIKEENGLNKPIKWVYRLSSNWEIKEKLFQVCFDSIYPVAEPDEPVSGLCIFPVISGEYLYSVEPTGFDWDKYGFCDYILYRQRLSKNSEKEILIEFGYNYARILAVTDDGVYFYREEADTHAISNIYRVDHKGTALVELPYKYDIYNFDEDGYYFVSNIDGKLYGIINNKIILIQ